MHFRVTMCTRTALTMCRLLAHSAGMARVRIRFRHFLIAFLTLSVFAAALSWTFTVWTGASIWTLQPDASATFWYVVAMNFVYWGSWAPLAVVVVRLASHWRLDAPTWKRSLGVHVAAGCAVACMHIVMVATGRTVLQRLVGMDVSWVERVSEMLLRTIDWEVLLYGALVALQHAMHYYEELRLKDVTHAQLETQLVESQLQALQRQLHPHFLFNTLHAISAFVHRDPEKAEAMIERLSDLLRVTLDRVGDQEVTLAEELEYLRAYLDIEQIHFGSRLEIVYSIDARALDNLVPNLILQPIAENAIRHGLEPQAARGRLSVTALRDGPQLLLTIADTGRGVARMAPARGRQGVGVANTRARLDRLYRGQASLAFSETHGGGLTATISLPSRTQSTDEDTRSRRRRSADGTRAVARAAG